MHREQGNNTYLTELLGGWNNEQKNAQIIIALREYPYSSSLLELAHHLIHFCILVPILWKTLNDCLLNA